MMTPLDRFLHYMCPCLTFAKVQMVTFRHSSGGDKGLTWKSRKVRFLPRDNNIVRWDSVKLFGYKKEQKGLGGDMAYGAH